MRAISAATRTRNAAQVFPTMATLGALGVVYGDIGTSPLYALREAAKAASGESMPTPEAVLGTVSLITWSLIVIISLKYAVLMLRADNRGEGGAEASPKFLTKSAEKRSSRLSKFQVCGYGANLFMPLCSETLSAQPHISAFLQLRLSKSESK